jgi:Sec-independent protein translocase protein TatA
MLFLAMIALLIFGKDLPHVLRQWGKMFNEFRGHLNSVRSELNDAIYAEPERPRLQYHPQFQKREETAPPALGTTANGESAGDSRPPLAAEDAGAGAPDMPSD